MIRLRTEPLTPQAFAPFGDVLQATGTPDRLINNGYCGRWHDMAQLDFGPGGRAGLNLFKAQPRSLPYVLDLLERHPEGSQAFVPMYETTWLVTVAEDAGGTPVNLRAFLVAPGQAINLHRGTWHGVLTPLAEPGLFAVIDRIGSTANLEEYPLTPHYVVE
ncbi:MAG: ureidoglycolate lyase [Rhodobacteraceae bacterium]|jgi:ureidoglycolate lyase|nr:ureidoglycolate lyase [Paracoccaceae bacterium]